MMFKNAAHIWMRWMLTFLFLGFGTGVLQAQENIESPQDTSKKVIVDHADIGEYISKDGETIQRLMADLRQVELRQEDVFMYCDTAIIIDNNVTAFGNVIIQQGDSLNVFADSLSYKGDRRVADFYGNVILESSDQKLFTNQLNYNVENKVATYYSGAMLTNKETQLTSKRGYYYIENDEAFFKDSVVIIDPEFVLRSDTLKYNTETEIATFLGPTLITQDSARIYCEKGFYNLENRSAEFYQNAEYVKGEQIAIAKKIKYDGNKKEVRLEEDAVFKENDKIATADVIRYEEETEITHLEGNAIYQDPDQYIESDIILYNQREETFASKGRSKLLDPPQILIADQIDYNKESERGIAQGNVVWIDTVENITVECEHADYNKTTDYLIASGGRPFVTSLVDEDTMYLSSDTLISFREPGEDSLRTMLAYQNVKIFKADLQAVCDSLSYSSVDSIFRFYQDPIIWSDTTQFTADTVNMFMKDDQIHRIYLINDAFIINSPDETFFNQIKGKDITAMFKDNELRRMKVNGNAESVYYARDDEDAYIAVNKTKSSRMLVFFGNNEIDDIRFYKKPEATLSPMKQTNHEALKMQGFNWQTQLRPITVADLR